MIYLVLAVLSLYIISVPLAIVFSADVDTNIDRAVITVKFMFVPVFKKHIDVKRIKSMLNGETEAHEENEHIEEDNEIKSSETELIKHGKIKKFLIACAVRIVARIRLRALDCEAVIGTGDAAASAMTAGSVKIALLQACAYFGFDGKNIDITPEYNTERLFLDFFGIISLCFTDIIFAVMGALYDTLRKKTGKRSYYANTATE